MPAPKRRKPVHKRAIDKAKDRPAETTSGIVGTIVAIAAFGGVNVSSEAVAAIVAAVGFIPGIVSALVDRFEG